MPEHKAILTVIRKQIAVLEAGATSGQAAFANHLDCVVALRRWCASREQATAHVPSNPEIVATIERMLAADVKSGQLTVRQLELAADLQRRCDAIEATNMQVPFNPAIKVAVEKMIANLETAIKAVLAASAGKLADAADLKRMCAVLERKDVSGPVDREVTRALGRMFMMDGSGQN